MADNDARIAALEERVATLETLVKQLAAAGGRVVEWPDLLREAAIERERLQKTTVHGAGDRNTPG